MLIWLNRALSTKLERWHFIVISLEIGWLNWKESCHIMAMLMYCINIQFTTALICPDIVCYEDHISSAWNRAWTEKSRYFFYVFLRSWGWKHITFTKTFSLKIIFPIVLALWGFDANYKDILNIWVHAPNFCVRV